MYQHIAWAYDQIFPLQEATLHFLKEHLPKGVILDLACGTGAYAIALAKAGYQVIASDLSEDMIHFAKTLPGSEMVTFKVEDMFAFEATQLYDGIYIIGNSLSYTKNLSHASMFFDRLYQSLKPNGTFIVQILNYDRILHERLTTLPPIHKEGMTFLRRYQYLEDGLLFHTEIQTETEIKAEVHRLYPLRKQHLLGVAQECGFHLVDVYGDFKRATFNKDTSYHTIAVWKK